MSEKRELYLSGRPTIINPLSVHSKYANTIPRPFGVRYNAYTESIEVLDSKKQIEDLITNIQVEFSVLRNALTKLE